MTLRDYAQGEPGEVQRWLEHATGALREQSRESGMRFPAVAVVVPAFNSVATIGACIESLLAQHYPAECYKIIVVDNNSTDGTACVVRAYPEVTLSFEREVQTSYAARNRGIALAKSEVVAFTDADCIADRYWLRNLVRHFTDPGLGVCGGRIASHTTNSSLIETFMAEVQTAYESTFRASEPLGFPTGNVAYSTAALAAVGVFDASMPGGGDVDLAWRVQAYGGYQGTYDGDAVVYHRHRSTLPGLFGQYRRYGFTEIALSTLYRGEGFHQRTPTYQLRTMGRQLRALGTYVVSFLIRLARFRRWRSDRLYLALPLFWFVLESGSLVGKCRGLINTRFFRRSPFRTNQQEVRRSPVAMYTTTATQHTRNQDPRREMTCGA